MLSRIAIRNYQSLANVDLELAPFTVIEGPSSSGKSAVTRAIKLLTSNARGDSWIRHGERVCTVEATTDKGKVILKRGRGTSDNEYTTIPNDPAQQQRTFTKLGGAVPPEVTEFIGIAAKDPINYAGQFDKPYLLDESSGEVARTLGELTNVNLIFEGARESNRRKLATSSILKSKADDLAEIRLKLPMYATLKEQREHLDEAHSRLNGVGGAVHWKQTLDQLNHHIETIQVATVAVKTAQQNVEIHVPDISTLVSLAGQLQLLDQSIASLVTLENNAKMYGSLLAETDEELANAQKEYREAMAELHDGILGYWDEHARTMDKHPETGHAIIDKDEAAQLAANYIVEVLG